MTAASVPQFMRWAAYLGPLMVVLLGALMALLPASSPEMPPGFITPVIAFEFAQTPAEVEALFGEAGSAERDALSDAMDRGNRFDYVFMLAYGAFLTCFSLGVAQLAGRRYLLPAALGSFAALADAWENALLFDITANLGGDYQAALAWLPWVTWAKWGALTLGLLLLAPWLLRAGGVLRVAGWLALPTALSAVLSLLNRGFANEVFALCLWLALGALVAGAIRIARKGAPVA